MGLVYETASAPPFGVATPGLRTAGIAPATHFPTLTGDRGTGDQNSAGLSRDLDYSLGVFSRVLLANSRFAMTI